MFSRKTSVATVDATTHHLVFSPYSDESKRHSAAPFALAAPGPESDASTRFQAFDLPPRRSSAFPMRERTTSTGAGKFAVRVGRTLTRLLPTAGSAYESPTRETPTIQIEMEKETQVIVEEYASISIYPGGGLSKKAAPALRMRPSEENVHRPNVGPPVPLTATPSLSSLQERRTRRKPPPLDLDNLFVKSKQSINTDFEPSRLPGPYASVASLASGYSPQVGFPLELSPPPRLSSKTPLRTHFSGSQASFLPSPSPSLPPPIPPRSPRRAPPTPSRTRFYYPTATNSRPLVNGSILAPSRNTQPTLGTTWRLLFSGVRGSSTKKGAIQSKKGAVLVARKASLKRRKGKGATTSAKSLSSLYLPHSQRSSEPPTPPPKLPSATSKHMPSPSLSGVFGSIRGASSGHRRRPSLPSFLPLGGR